MMKEGYVGQYEITKGLPEDAVLIHVSSAQQSIMKGGMRKVDIVTYIFSTNTTHEDCVMVIEAETTSGRLVLSPCLTSYQESLIKRNDKGEPTPSIRTHYASSFGRGCMRVPLPPFRHIEFVDA